MKQLAEVTIRSLDGEEVLHNTRGVEMEILGMAKLQAHHLQSLETPHLSVILNQGALTFALSSGNHAEKPLTIDLDSNPEWNRYVLANLDAMGESVAKIDAVLQSSFLDAATKQLSPDMKKLGQAIGDALNYRGGIILGQGPHSYESQLVLMKLVHGLIGFCPSVHQRYESSEALARQGAHAKDPAFALTL